MYDQKHSGLGIASFIISILGGILIFAILAAATLMEAATPGGLDEKSEVMVAFGLGLLALLGGEFVALGLGIGGLFQTGREKIFAILGTVFSAVTLSLMISIIVLGFMIE